MRDKLKLLIEGQKFQIIIIGFIIFNALILGLETSKFMMDNFGLILKLTDYFILKIFVIEILLRIYVYRFKFFLRPWSIFDFIVVAVALIPSSEAFAALRTLRVLRVLRLVSTIPSMRKVVEGLLSAIPGIISVTSIIAIFFYIFAVIGTHLYSDSFPEWFGSLGKTMFTLFQIMTLESWSMGIVRPVMDVHPTAWIFFILYILITTFTMLNLFIAIIVNAMHSEYDESAQKSREEMKQALSKEIKEMEKNLLKAIKK